MGRLLIVMLAAPLSVACATLLGVESLPLREVSDAEPDVDPGLGTRDGEPSGDGGCAPRGTSFCGTQCPVPDFCEDFESEEAGSFARWSGYGTSKNPLEIEGGTLGIVIDDAGTRSHVLASQASRPGTDRSLAGLLHTIFDAGPNPRGLRVQFTGTMREIVFDEDSGSSGRSAYLFAVGDPFANQGVTIVFKDKGASTLDVVLQRRPLFNDGEIVDLVALGGVGKDDIANSRPNFEFEVAPRSVLLERQHACPEVDGTADGGDASAPSPGPDAMWLWVKIYVEKCLPLSGSLASPDWLHQLALIGGVFVNSYGRAETRLDDVALTYLR